MKGIDDKAQVVVAQQMKKRAERNDPMLAGSHCLVFFLVSPGAEWMGVSDICTSRRCQKIKDPETCCFLL